MVSVQGDVPARKVRITRPRVSHPAHVQYSQRLTEVPLVVGLPDEDSIYEELQGYTDILLGREEPPVDSPYLQLAEIATAYYARGLELDMLIHQGEDEGVIKRGSQYYRIRTGVLRSFIDMTKRMADLGSRRLTQETLISQQRRDAGERA